MSNVENQAGNPFTFTEEMKKKCFGRLQKNQDVKGQEWCTPMHCLRM